MNKIHKLIKKIEEDFDWNNGLYCWCRLKNIQKIRKIIKENFDLNFNTKYYPHITIMASKSVPRSIGFMNTNEKLIGVGRKFEILGDSLVMMIDSNDAIERNKKIEKYGCKHIYENYIPHMTIIDKYQDNKNSKIFNKNFYINLEFGKEELNNLVE